MPVGRRKVMGKCLGAEAYMQNCMANYMWINCFVDRNVGSARLELVG